MEIIQDVGAYAGFAAVVGLAVLSVLYFSQARDVRRLREWAGRAPERVAEGAAAQQIVAQQQVAPEQAAQQATRPAPTGAVRPIPAAKPATAATGSGPATAAQPGAKEEAGKPAATPGPPVPATAAAAAAKGAQGKPAAAPSGAPDAPGAAKPEAKPAAATPAAGPTPSAPAPPTKTPPAPPGGAPAKAPAPAQPVPRVPAAPPAGGSKLPPLPPRPAPVGRAPGAGATSQSTAVLPPSARVRDRTAGTRRGLDSRYIALIVAGVIVVGGGVAFGISQLGGDDDQGAQQSAQDGDVPAGPINRSLVTVSVLNGTTVPGLAAQIGDEVESKGFQRGNVANAIDQQRSQSIVMYAEGAERPARVVARGLGISQLEPVDPDSQALAGNASVVVIVGSDRTQ